MPSVSHKEVSKIISRLKIYLNYFFIDCSLDNYDIHGNILKKTLNVRDWQNCHRLCYNEARCYYWTYNKVVKDCFLHDKAEKISASTDYKIGQKKCPSKQDWDKEKSKFQLKSNQFNLYNIFGI